MNVATLIAELIQREGGYVHHPADRGGPTKFGITQETLSAARGDHASADDVRALSIEEATEIYRRSYYLGPGIDRLPEPWQAAVFDWGVNSGPVTAIRDLQRLCRGHGYDPGPIDGVIGPQTIAAATGLLTVPVRWYLKRRRDFYQALVAANPRQEVFLAGWLARVDGLEDALHG